MKKIQLMSLRDEGKSFCRACYKHFDPNGSLDTAECRVSDKMFITKPTLNVSELSRSDNTLYLLT